jgi:glucose-1-phosphate thymidylyltransferase
LRSARRVEVNAILLAAGYGTRLYPLTKDRPKSLLPVGGRPILDYLVERLDAAPEIDVLFLVTNARFARDFESWAEERNRRAPGARPRASLRVLSDGTTSNEDRLGAVGDVQFVLDEAGIAHEGAYVLATDNLPRFDLRDIITLAKARSASAVFICRSTDTAELKRMGVAQVDADGLISAFEEKPLHPKGEFRVPPFYVYTPQATASVRAYLMEANNPDAPGHFLEWLVRRQEVYACRRDEGTYDIGTLETYRAVCAEFEHP